MDTFFGLFKPATKEAILNEVDFEGFKRIVEEKDAKPYDPNNPDFDTAEELERVRLEIEYYKSTQKTI